MNQSRAIIDELNRVRGFMKQALNDLKVEGREGFLTVGSDFFAGLMESNADQVARPLGRLWAITQGKDESVHVHAQLILEELAADPGIDPSILEDCPICATPSLKTFECMNCGFSFIEDFKCPHLTEDGARRCMKVNKPCNLFGLEFEECEIHNGSR